MQAFDPAKITAKPVASTGGGIEVSLTATGVEGTAYYRIDPKFRDFLKACHEKHGVAGFEYDFGEGGLNFGVILSNKMEANPNGQSTN